MDVLWSSDAALTANELRDALAVRGSEPGKAVATTTVLTVLSRLERKGFVSARARDPTAPLPRPALTRRAHGRAHARGARPRRATATPPWHASSAPSATARRRRCAACSKNRRAADRARRRGPARNPRLRAGVARSRRARAAPRGPPRAPAVALALWQAIARRGRRVDDRQPAAVRRGTGRIAARRLDGTRAGDLRRPPAGRLRRRARRGAHARRRARRAPRAQPRGHRRARRARAASPAPAHRPAR